MDRERQPQEHERKQRIPQWQWIFYNFTLNARKDGASAMHVIRWLIFRMSTASMAGNILSRFIDIDFIINDHDLHEKNVDSCSET